MNAVDRERVRQAVDQAARDRVTRYDCPGCGVRFTRNHAGHVYCSHACGARHYAKRQAEA